MATRSLTHGATPALVFQSTTFTPIKRKDQMWLSASEIARALGYAREDAISRIYQRNADEFRSDMTLTVKLTVKGFGNGNSDKPVRVFSLRGAHLVAMFARTPVAKDFRRWVLDVLDSPAGELVSELDATNAQAMHEMCKVADDYLDAYYEQIKAGKTRHHIDGVQPELRKAILARALVSQRMLVTFSSMGHMQCCLIPGDAAMVSFTKDDYQDIVQNIPMERIPDMLHALSKRVGTHLAAFSEYLKRERRPV